jgi:RES domain-containing protein
VITGWRIVKPEYADDAYSGEGARRAGGRWNSPGVPVAYCSETVALATLELLANIPRRFRLPEYVLVSCRFDESLVRQIGPLPDDWAGYPAPPEVQAIGNSWLLSGASAVLKVPSAIIQSEFNYVLNPEHPDFRSIDIGQPMPFRVDYRLLT